MRDNGPVTNKEVVIPESYNLSTTTDLRGTILSASNDFVKISGFTKQELIGQPHNILRHPDVPSQVFADMWRTLKGGKSWTGIVKNRAKNGDYYWVLANASPLVEHDKIVGYSSVRTPVTNEQKQLATQLYKDVSNSRVQFECGVPVCRGAKRFSFLTLRGSLTKVVSIYALVTLLVGLSLLSSLFFKMFITPLEQAELNLALHDAELAIQTKIATKSTSMVDMAAMMASDPVIKSVLAGELSRAAAEDRLGAMREHFAKISDYKNIRIQLYDTDGRSYLRSWKLAEHGDKHSDRIRDKAFTSQQVGGGLSIDKNDFGLGATGYAPVFLGEQLVGTLSVSGGLASVGRELKQRDMHWLMLLDEQSFEKGLPKTLEKNNAFSPGFIVANNQWFDEVDVAFFKQHLTQVKAGNQVNSYLINNQIVLDMPAYNQMGEEVGRHLLFTSAKDLNQKVDAVTHQVIMTLFGILLVVVTIVVLILIVVRRRVVKPIRTLLKSMTNMTKSGRFNDRIVQRDLGDEVGSIVDVYNRFTSNVQRSITNVNDVMSLVAQGQFDVSINDSVNGDLLVMKDAVNGSVASVRDTMLALEMVMDALYEGNFNVAMPDTIKGEFRNKVDAAVHALRSALADVNKTMNYMSQGKFLHRVEVVARGDLLTLKQTVNHSMDSLENAISEITQINKALSEGDLTQKIEGDYHGELRLLKDAVNTSITRLDAIVSVTKEAAQVVDGAAREVSNGSHDLSERVQEQATALEQTTATMDQMSSTIEHNTSNANQAADVALDVQSKAAQGLDVMQKTIEAMGQIQQSSHKIADIVTLIDSIAFQTNLLALNAAVEAARAGDHGRGFAVVAGEVRNLAQKSAEAARDIKNLIDESVMRIDNGSKMAAESGQVLSGITSSINDVTKMIAEIAKASNEQAEGIRHVHNAVNSIDRVTQQNAALVEETTAASESLSDQARNLSNEMSFFTISSEDRGDRQANWIGSAQDSSNSSVADRLAAAKTRKESA